MLGQKHGAFLFKYYFLTVAFEPVALVMTSERRQETAEASPGLTCLRQRQKASPLPGLRGGHAGPDRTAVDDGPWPVAPGLGQRLHGQEGRSLPRSRLDRKSVV